MKIIRNIRRFENWLNRLPVDWIVGLALGILFGAWAVYRLALAGGG